MKNRPIRSGPLALCLCLIFGLALSAPAFAVTPESVTLTADTAYQETTVILTDTTLDLNGYTLSLDDTTGSGSVLRVETGATLTIQDSITAKTGQITGGKAVTRAVALASNGAFGGGMVVDDRAGSGGGVYVAPGARPSRPAAAYMWPRAARWT